MFKRMLIALLFTLASINAALSEVRFADPASVSIEVKKLQPQDTLILRNGTYINSLTIESSDVLVLAETRYKVIFDGTPTHSVIVLKYSGTKQVSGVTIDGLYVRKSAADGIKTYSNGTKIRNCKIEDCVGNGISGFADGVWVENTEITRCGTDCHYHGIYANGKDHVYIGNKIWENEGHGLHLYSDDDQYMQGISGNKGITGSLVYKNNVWKNGKRVGSTRQILIDNPWNSPNLSSNYVIGNIVREGWIGISVWGNETSPLTYILGNQVSRCSGWEIHGVHFDREADTYYGTPNHYPPLLLQNNKTGWTVKLSDVPGSLSVATQPAKD